MASKADIRMRGFLKRTPVDQLISLIIKHSPVLASETVNTVDANGRVLAQDIVSPVNVPNFHRSAMDGYALDAESTFGASSYNPLTFQVVGQITPGDSFEPIVKIGEAVRIMTGGPLPQGTNSILMAELAEALGDEIQVMEAIPPGKHVGKIGEDIREHQKLFTKDRILRPQDIGVLISIGFAEIAVMRKPNVEILITGNELMKPGEKAEGYKIVDSNSAMLACLIKRDGGVVQSIKHLEDNRELIKKHLLHSSADVVCLSGGTSVGIEDHGPTLLEELGTLLVHGIPMRPAAPTGFGIIDEKKVFLIPGNPVSCLSAYDCFVGRSLRLMGGNSEQWPYKSKMVKLATKISSQIGRAEYVRLKIKNDYATLIASGGASILSSTTEADAFLITAEASEGFAEGEEVKAWLYD